MTWPLGEGIVSVLAKSTNTFLRITYGLARMPPGHFLPPKWPCGVWQLRGRMSVPLAASRAAAMPPEIARSTFGARHSTVLDVFPLLYSTLLEHALPGAKLAD